MEKQNRWNSWYLQPLVPVAFAPGTLCPHHSFPGRQRDRANRQGWVAGDSCLALVFPLWAVLHAAYSSKWGEFRFPSTKPQILNLTRTKYNRKSSGEAHKLILIPQKKITGRYPSLLETHRVKKSILETFPFFHQENSKEGEELCTFYMQL